MATARAVGEPEASDDSLSLMSTVASANEEDYEVECILAERKSTGIVEYLTAWKGYPETEHKWLPRENFNGDDIFNEWANTQKRIAIGLEKPFDIKACAKRCKAMERETTLRKERRRVKRLQLVQGGGLAGEQDGNIQSSGSDSAPKRSDRRIKRRSVHQDSPPSSSTSAPISSSGSEDSDRHLISRQESEIFISNSKWTQAETIALEEGLRTLKGPRWREILGLYGRNGTINHVLRDKAPSDLYVKAKSVCQEFLDSGREPPQYLKPFSKTASIEASRTSTPNIYSEIRGQSRAVSKKSSRCASADSVMAEFHEKQRIREAKNREKTRLQQDTNSTETSSLASRHEKESNTAKKSSGDNSTSPKAFQAPARKAEIAAANETPKETLPAMKIRSSPPKKVSHSKSTIEVKGSGNSQPHRGRQPEDGLRAKEHSKISAVPQTEIQAESQASSAKEMVKPTTNAAAQPDFSHPSVPENIESVRGETARTTWSGTARAPTARSNRSRLGHGPTQPSSSKLKPKVGQIEPKKPSATGDVTAAWNAEPKKRMSNKWATKNADPVNGQPANRSYKLSVQNRIFKSRREGPPPDADRLVFIDPKTGKAPTKVPAPSPTAMLSKTPLQLHQEGLAASEAEGRRAEEVQDPMVISTSEPDPPPEMIEQNRETSVNKQKVSDTGMSVANTSESAVRPASDMTDSPAHIDTLIPIPPTSPRPDLPSNTPRGPRIETKRSATMSLQDYTKRSMPSAHRLDEAVISSRRLYSSDDPSTFSLRVYPSREHKMEIFNKPDQSVVIGDIKFGEDDQESIKVKFLGFEFDVKKLLLTIKSLPRAVDFVFKSVCLASEYKAYFPAVSPPYQRKSAR